MTGAFEDHHGAVSTGGQTIANLWFVDINGFAGDEEELATLVNHLDRISSTVGMEISAERTKLMRQTVQLKSKDRSKSAN